ncbi:flagellar basal body rod protein FlgF [Aquicella lusitana]|uniref:Flagellar basal-body rod protein FlgF n=1 Tax=Aquicella lusitana TaxID=254246 RepID=A0A370GAA2_9COXI|nr:flagellar basal body rod protein FlgF [Aquicella lusitana]RDI39959.1 flagellar basal-body rod protein FlgF [Aquicella lusitana]VVC74562.1 Flagellar basal-body rod protein FlgF [Aquicella lusitana]
MVDKALFIGSSGAKDSMHELEILANNLANITTTGFRADHEVIKQVPINENNKQTRFYSSVDKSFSNFEPGPITETGRDLDVAISGQGFIAVQSKSGQEAFTRAGDLQLKNGFLTTQAGDLVLGSSGVVNVPDQAQRIALGQDGTITVKIAGQTDMVNIDRIKLVNPDISKLHKGIDGLFYLAEGESARQDNSVRVRPGALEGSNVNAVEALTDLIELSRRFEMHTHLMKDFKDNASKANQILSLPR